MQNQYVCRFNFLQVALIFILCANILILETLDCFKLYLRGITIANKLLYHLPLYVSVTEKKIVLNVSY